MMREAARLAELAGDEGYEVEVDANATLGFMLPFIGLHDEAEERLRRLEKRAGDKGDEFHLAALWNNRACLWIARNDRERFLEDSARLQAYCRRMGNAHFEHDALLNSAYFLYWRGELEDAVPFARRLIEVDERYFRKGEFRPDGAVLLARIHWGQGDQDAARKLVESVQRHQAAARAAGKAEVLLQPNDEMLLEMTALLVTGAGGEPWDALVARAEEVAQGQELIEVLELAGLSARRRGDRERTRRFWERAWEVGLRIPSVMSDRIRRRLEEFARGGEMT
jgi:tetratricopeptide (TPR) repeat protein